MNDQSYATHVHRPLPTAIGFACWVTSAIGFGAWVAGRSWGLGLGVAGLLLAVLVLLAISRLYTVRLQDRIIRLESHLRAERLLTPGQLAQFERLQTPQVVALRFASDAEFPALCERAATERLPSDAIKRAIVAWRADRLRT